jgi:hypothetical protein
MFRLGASHRECDAIDPRLDFFRFEAAHPCDFDLIVEVPDISVDRVGR